MARLVRCVLAFALVLPWMLYMQANGQGLSMTGWDIRSQYVRDFHATLEFTRNEGASLVDLMFAPYETEPRKNFKNALDKAHTAELSRKVDGWEELSRKQKQELVAEERLKQIGGYSAWDYVRAVIPNWRWTLVSGGEGDFLKSLGIDPKTVNRDDGLPYWAMKVIFLGFSIGLKLLALYGLYAGLVVQRRYDAVLICVAAIAYILAAHVYYGGPRYRVPIEPAFVVLAILGLQSLSMPWGRSKSVG